MSAVRPIVIGAFLLGLAIGAICGAVVGRPRSESPDNRRSPKTASQGADGPNDRQVNTHVGVRDIPDDPVTLKEIVARQRAEIDTLAARMAESERRSQHGPAPQDKRAIANQIYDAFLGLLHKTMANGVEDPNYMRALARLEALDGDMVSFFVEKYRRAEGEERRLALELAIHCGGREASEFVKGLLQDPSVSGKDREDLLRIFDTWGWGSIFPSKRFPVDPELAQMAFRLADSPKIEERSGSAGILGHYDDPTSRVRLQQLAHEDSDVGVRITAIRALSRVGDRGTLAYLTSYSVPSDQPNLQHELNRTLAKLKRRFPD